MLFPGRLLQSVLPPRGQVGDAMEIVILSILSSQLRCEWRLDSYQVALMSSVRKPTPRECLVKVGGRHDFSLRSQSVFLATAIGSPIWGIFCDKYGRRIVSVPLVLFHVDFLRVLTFELCGKQGLILSSSCLLYFGLLSALAPVYSWLIFLRFLVGFSIAGCPHAYVPIVTDIQSAL